MPIDLSPETRKACEDIIRRYPQGKKEAALLPLLHLAQGEWGYLPLEGIKYMADMLQMPHARAAGVMSFYPMLHKGPVGKYAICVCSSLSCALCGAEALVNGLQDRLKIDVGETTKDGKFTLIKVECIAACDGAPAMLINETLYRHVTLERLDEILDGLE